MNLLYVLSTPLLCYLAYWFDLVASKDAEKHSNNIDVVILVLSQPNTFHHARADLFRDHLAKQAKNLRLTFEVISIHEKYPDKWGGWAVFPLLADLISEFGARSKFLMICEEETRIRLDLLEKYLKKVDHTKRGYVGHGLFDRDTTIIHHYMLAGKDTTSFKYPDFAGGVLFTWPVLEYFLKALRSDKLTRKIDFIIDAKHEFAVALNATAGAPLTVNDRFCTTRRDPDCITYYLGDEYLKSCKNKVFDRDMYIAVKTYHEFHKTRVVTVKRTWGSKRWNIEYFSDQEDLYIPTLTLGLANTEKGHCAKTYAILNRFMDTAVTDAPWLVILDDDSLISLPRLLRLLRCYNPNEPVILGERYAYGFTVDGTGGYEYPTGGSSVIFNRAAVATMLNSDCHCPRADSPDDMVLGMCARNIRLRMLTNAGFHQARPQDYAEDYLARSLAITFHKHQDIDPIQVYQDWLEDRDKDETVELDNGGQRDEL